MSCHDIGRGMNAVVKETVALMDSGEISRDAAKKIIRCCRESVDWCDGNEYEAVDYIDGCICGRCMKKIPKGKKLYSLSDTSKRIPWDAVNMICDKFASCRLCEECFDEVVERYCNDKNAGPAERRYIEENNDEEAYISTGEYKDDNNGYRW